VIDELPKICVTCADSAPRGSSARLKAKWIAIPFLTFEPGPSPQSWLYLGPCEQQTARQRRFAGGAGCKLGNGRSLRFHYAQISNGKKDGAECPSDRFQLSLVEHGVPNSSTQTERQSAPGSYSLSTLDILPVHTATKILGGCD
jgi:hypothetical protein